MLVLVTSGLSFGVQQDRTGALAPTAGIQRLLPQAYSYRVPAPSTSGLWSHKTQKYVKSWPFRLFFVALGYSFTYFWGPGTLNRLWDQSPLKLGTGTL